MRSLMISVCALGLGIAGCDSDSFGNAPDAGPDVVTDGGAEAATCGVPNAPCCSGACQGGSSCVSGSCACGAGTTACGSACVDTSANAKHCGACGHDCLGGACDKGTCQPFTLATGQALTAGLAIDDKAVYWSRAKGASTSGGVFSVGFDGKGVKPIRDYAQQALGATRIALAGSSLFFVRSGGATDDIARCALPDCANGEVVVANGQAIINELAVDVGDNRMYWVTRTPYNTQTNGAVFTLSLLGGTPQRFIVADQPNPTDLVVANGFVYWLNSGTYTTDLFNQNGGVRRSVKGATGSSGVVVNDTREFHQLASDGQDVFFGDTSSLFTAPATAGAASASPFATPTHPLAIEIDGSNVYWTDSQNVLTCPRKGCPGGKATVLVANQDGVAELAQDAVSIVWANGNSGEIRRLAK